jgi:hypothetical protein
MFSPISNLELATDILESAEYIYLYKDNDPLISPLILKNFKDDVELSWYVNNEHQYMAHQIFLSIMLNWYDYRKETSEFVRKKSEADIYNYDIISFFNTTPIEINEMFNNAEDIMNMFKPESRRKNLIILENNFYSYKYNLNNREIKQYIMKLLGGKNPINTKKTYAFFDILNFYTANYFNFESIFSWQHHIKNNTIYKENGEYFRFYQLTPVGFDKAIMKQRKINRDESFF